LEEEEHEGAGEEERKEGWEPPSEIEAGSDAGAYVGAYANAAADAAGAAGAGGANTKTGDDYSAFAHSTVSNATAHATYTDSNVTAHGNSSSSSSSEDGADVVPNYSNATASTAPTGAPTALGWDQRSSSSDQQSGSSSSSTGYSFVNQVEALMNRALDEDHVVQTAVTAAWVALLAAFCCYKGCCCQRGGSSSVGYEVISPDATSGMHGDDQASKIGELPFRKTLSQPQPQRQEPLDRSGGGGGDDSSPVRNAKALIAKKFQVVDLFAQIASATHDRVALPTTVPAVQAEGRWRHTEPEPAQTHSNLSFLNPIGHIVHSAVTYADAKGLASEVLSTTTHSSPSADSSPRHRVAAHPDHTYVPADVARDLEMGAWHSGTMSASACASDSASAGSILGRDRRAHSLDNSDLGSSAQFI